MHNNEIYNIWDQFLILIEKKVTPIVYNTWIKSLIPIGINNDVFQIGTPKNFIKEWIEEHYIDVIESTLYEVHKSKQYTIKIVTLNEEEDNSDNNEQYKKEDIIKQNNEQNNIKNKEIKNNTNTLNSKYTFSSFVIGNSNRFAHAASLAVSESPGKVYNPLFIYGGVGLGKTHLMHAIGQKILEENSHKKISYISSEKFTNELINSIRDGSTEKFRQKYRNIDCLLIDDIQFLAKKEHTQEEFFHTFNTLYDLNKQIVISSDRTPKEIPTLENRLISRFEWGLVTDIQSPDIETRIAILRKKTLDENLNIPNDVLFFIASKIKNNIRELEGALLRVIAFSSLNNIPINMDSTTEALQHILPTKINKNINIEYIQEIVCSYFKIKRDDLLAKKRTKNIVYPRQIAMYICREMTNSSLPKIGESFGGRDHTTVIHSIEKINKNITNDGELKKDIDSIIQKINS